MQIRPTTIDDLPAVDALLARSYPKLLKADYPPSVLVTAIPVIARAQPKLLRCGTYYVVEENGRILGAGGWTRDRTDKALGHIRHVVTDDRALRRGVGRTLIAHCFEVAKASGVRQMECWATRNAEQFYQAQGFETIGPIDVPMAEGVIFPSIRMLCDL